MAGRGSPSFLKRQKEQARTARANAKRAARQARRDNRAANKTDQGLDEEVSGELLDGEVSGETQEPEPGQDDASSD
jgi:hypothetical protein